MSWSSAFHFTIIFIFALLLAGFQTSFWFQAFGAVAPPLLWLIVFSYLAVYREGLPAMFQLMFLAVALAAFTATGLKVFYLTLLIYYLLLHFFKSRIFWSGSGYFLMICAIGSVSFHLIFILAAMVIDKNKADWLAVDRLTQILLTPAFAIPIYWVMSALDGIFVKKEIKTETGAMTYD